MDEQEFAGSGKSRKGDVSVWRELVDPERAIALLRRSSPLHMQGLGQTEGESVPCGKPHIAMVVAVMELGMDL